MLTIAILGRPNVGKSTLFNRLIGKKRALVDDTPGVTRDRRVEQGSFGDFTFQVIDTAGLEENPLDFLESSMQAQSQAAIREADICLFVIDARVGITPVDSHFANILRQGDKPIVLVANKAEGRAAEAGFYDAFRLGFGEPVAISAEHGEGMADLHAALQSSLAEIAVDGKQIDTDVNSPLRLAVIGRPNTGKSTFINQLIGQERLLTGPVAGMTRDSIAVDWQWQDRAIRLFDTAGLRRKAKVQSKLEKLAVSDTLHAVQFAEVVVIMCDVTAPFEKQDLHIANLVAQEGRACVLALNKWDLAHDQPTILKDLRVESLRLLPQFRGVPVMPLSGASGYGVSGLMGQIFSIYDVWNTRLSTADLNRWLTDILMYHPPPAVSGKRIKLRYMTQVKKRPPCFYISCSRPDALPASYHRFLANALAADFGLKGIPLRLLFRKNENPYAGKRKMRR